MEYPTKFIGIVGAGFTTLATLYGGATFTHDKLQQIDSMQNDIYLIGTRLESKILNDRYTILQQRINDIEIRYGSDLFEAPGPIRAQYRIMKNELEALDKEITNVQQEYKRQNNGQSNSSDYYERSKSLGVE